MEKKKSKISIILLIIAIIVIAVIGVYIYKSIVLDDSENSTSKSDDVKNNIAEDDDVENEVEENEVEENTLSDEKDEKLAKGILDKYVELELYKFEDSSIGPFPHILINLGLESSENIDALYNSGEHNDPSEYIKSDVKYEDFKEEMLKYVSEEYFLNNYSHYKNMNGYVGFCLVAAGLPPIEIEDVEFVSKNENKYVFSVTIKDVEVYEHYLAGETYEDIEYLHEQTISFEKVNNNLVIDEFLFDEIIIDGIYVVEDSDVSYNFKSDGTVTYSTNLSETKGTYETTGNAEVEITFKTITIWDEELNTETTEKENRSEIVVVTDEETLNIIGEIDGEQYNYEIIKFTQE